MAIRTQIRLVQLTGSLNDTVGASAAADGPDADSLQGVLDQAAAAIKRITGGTTYASQGAGLFSQSVSVAPASAAATLTIGDASANDHKIVFDGNAQDFHIGLDDDLDKLQIGLGSALGTTPNMTLNSADRDVAFLGNIDVATVATAATFEPDGDTAASDNAAIGYTAAEGIIVTGQGSTSDVTLKNDNDGTVLTIPTGTENVDVVGDVSAATFLPDGDTATGDAAAVGYTAAEGIIITGQGSTNDVTIKNDADAEVIGIPTGAVNVVFAGNIKGPNDMSIGSATTADALVIESDGDLVLKKDLKLATDGSSVVNAAGADVITINKEEVIIPGDLTVRGTTTSIDTTNLEVEDKFIGLNYTSGSIPGGLGDVGVIMAQAREGLNMAMYYDQSESRFKFVATSSPASGSSITDGAFQDLEVNDLLVTGLDIKNEQAAAITLTAGATPNVGVQNNLTLGDDKSVVFGGDSDASIKYDEAGSDKLQILAGGNGILASVSAGDIVFGNSAIGAASLGDVMKVSKVGSVGHVQVSGSITSFGTDALILSSAAGTELRMKSADDLMFLDVYKPATWSDADGIALAANASDWADFETAFGSEVSLMRGIIKAQGGAGTLQKKTVEITGTGTNAELNLDLDSLTGLEVRERCDVYLNGQLMVSSSDIGGNGDYVLDTTDGLSSVDATFQFDLVLDDVVQAVVR